MDVSLGGVGLRSHDAHLQHVGDLGQKRRERGSGEDAILPRRLRVDAAIEDGLDGALHNARLGHDPSVE
eukprot:5337882-Pyramimonas_sp.AAC.2